jgi:hypothetical protein
MSVERARGSTHHWVWAKLVVSSCSCGEKEFTTKAPRHEDKRTLNVVLSSCIGYFMILL